jgi:hypothetical protein
VLNETFDVQIVRTAADSLLDKYYFSDRSVSGYFQLTYAGGVSMPINAQASAVDLRDALESLPAVHTVLVNRDYSAVKLSSLLVVSPGLLTVTCALSACDFSGLPPGELIRINSNWYRVEENFAGSATTLPLALATDASVPSFYNGTASASMPLYRWARGYEWTVTFLSTSVSPMQQLGSLKHGLTPADSTVAIRSAPCVNCATIGSLSSFTNYGLTLRPFNVYGFGPGSYSIGTPKEIPGAPSSITVTGNTGTSLLVTFTIPSGTYLHGVYIYCMLVGLTTHMFVSPTVANQQISAYTVEWDTTPLFVNASSVYASCSSAGFGRCDLTGAAILSNPIEYVIQNLALGVQYFIRVAARNVLSSATSANSSSDNTNWSDTVSYTVNTIFPFIACLNAVLLLIACW